MSSHKLSRRSSKDQLEFEKTNAVSDSNKIERFSLLLNKKNARRESDTTRTTSNTQKRLSWSSTHQPCKEIAMLLPEDPTPVKYKDKNSDIHQHNSFGKALQVSSGPLLSNFDIQRKRKAEKISKFMGSLERNNPSLFRSTVVKSNFAFADSGKNLSCVTQTSKLSFKKAP
jgi:hypothetical protein